MTQDWGSDMAAFIEWRRRQPPLDASLGRDYVAHDDKDGVEHTLYGNKVPGYEDGPGMDPGIFPRG